MNAKPRVLLAITVYNGRSFVPACLSSAKLLEQQTADIDVLVLDDCSPEEGFSAFLKEHCVTHGFIYYRTPRNLGIVRNVNMGLLAALKGGYDFVIISNSDVIYSRQTVEQLLCAYASNPGIGSVTALSNNVSIFSLPNADPDRHLSKQESVDWVAESLARQFKGVAVDVPAGISFCILIPTSVIQTVGLMDPVFGRGYCEETDWTLRSLARGYRITLAPAAFVYHRGRGSTVAAGMVSGGHSTVPANEAIIDFRYPLFRDQVNAFVRGGVYDQLKTTPVELLLRVANDEFGHDVQICGAVDIGDAQRVICRVPSDLSEVVISYKGFEFRPKIKLGQQPLEVIRKFFLDGLSTPPSSASTPLAPRAPLGTASYPLYV